MQEWGHVKLMVVGEGAAGKTQTVRSLLGLEFQKEHISTEVADVTVARTGDNWAVHDVGDSDFDLLAQRAAAARANNHGQPAPKLKRASFSSRLSQSIKRVVSKGKPAASPAAPPAAPPARPPQGARLDDQEVARRFDFAAIKELAAMTDSGTKVSFTMWDYGGQTVFYTLHHIFLSQNGLYLVVFNMAEVLEHASEVKEYLRFWLNSIRLHAPGAPIVLIGTRADQVTSQAERKQINIMVNPTFAKFGFGENNRSLTHGFFHYVNNANIPTFQPVHPTYIAARGSRRWRVENDRQERRGEPVLLPR